MSSNLFEKLNFRDKILLSLLAAGAVVEDVLVESFDPMGLKARYYGYSLETVDYFKERGKSLKRALAHFVRKKLVELKEKEGATLYQLTSDGLDRLFAKFPKFKYGGQTWDGFWRVAIYDIKETEKRLRQRLRRELKHLGFHLIQKSVWFSPYAVENDLTNFLKREKLWGKILLLKAALPTEETRHLALSFWPEIGQKKIKVKTAQQTKHSPSNAGLVARASRLLADPLLPKGLANP